MYSNKKVSFNYFWKYTQIINTRAIETYIIIPVPLTENILRRAYCVEGAHILYLRIKCLFCLPRHRERARQQPYGLDMTMLLN